jgi:ABC-type polysaccharide transport system, permease component
MRMKKSIFRTMRQQYELYLLFLIPLVWYIVFQYVPLYGVQIAFRRFNPGLGITNSPWVGMQYFKQFFNSYYFSDVLLNTLILNVYQMALGFPMPIILALMIHELQSNRLKKLVQNVTYIPYFLSMVVVASMLRLFSNPNYGLFNQIFGLFGVPPHEYFVKAEHFRSLYVFSGVWQNMGFNSVIYIAALAGIDPQLYEAANIDGASRLRKIWHISLPGILPTIVILFIMRIGSLMNVGFEKVLLMQNPVNLETSEVIASFIYKNGIQKGNFSYSAAVGIFNSIINLILLAGSNLVSRRITESSLW